MLNVNTTQIDSINQQFQFIFNFNITLNLFMFLIVNNKKSIRVSI